jgi:site-specific recombinase XerD
MPERDRALVLVLGDTGARAGGIVSLTLDRLRLENGLLEVIEKGDKSRLLPLTPVTVEALRDWLAVRPDNPKVPYVFTSWRGEQLTTFGLHQAIDRIAKRAGVTGRSNLHAFRHFFGRKWVESGGDISTLAEVLGHTQIHVTKTFYLRYDTEMIKREHEKHSPLAQQELLHEP